VNSVADGRLRVYTIGGACSTGELDAKSAIDMGLRLAIEFTSPVVPGKHVFATEPVWKKRCSS
jgi:hypothetical protein